MPNKMTTGNIPAPHPMSQTAASNPSDFHSNRTKIEGNQIAIPQLQIHTNDTKSHRIDQNGPRRHAHSGGYTQFQPQGCLLKNDPLKSISPRVWWAYSLRFGASREALESIRPSCLWSKHVPKTRTLSSAHHLPRHAHESPPQKLVDVLAIHSNAQ